MRKIRSLQMLSTLWLTLFLGHAFSAPAAKELERSSRNASKNNSITEPALQIAQQLIFEATNQIIVHSTSPSTTNLLTSNGSDFIDGNHPSLPPVLTHDEVDTSFSGSLQTKRVKKILPPYHNNTTKNQNVVTPEMNRSWANNSSPSQKEQFQPTDRELTAIESQRVATNYTKQEGLRSIVDNVFTSEQAILNETGKVIAVTENLLDDIFIPVSISTLSTIYQTENNYPVDGKENAAKPDRSLVETLVTKRVVFTTITPTPSSGGEIEIDGIQLVPKKNPSTTDRTMWDMLLEQQNSISDETQRDDIPKTVSYRGKIQTSKTSFSDFDAESQEMEYESENIQTEFSNIKNHELPISYALPWLQVQDKEFDSEKDSTNLKLTEAIDGTSRITAVSPDEEELRIPADVSQLLRLAEIPELGADVAVSIVQSGSADIEPRGCTKWYLLLLTGNSTIVQRRRDDFTKYLRLNLAARLSVEYDDVKVNKLILAPPKVLVNVSVYAPSDDIAEESQLDLKEKFEEKGEGPLHKLAESNATLLELSGEEYKVVRFLSLQGQPPAAEAQRETPRVTSMSSRHDDIEFVIYTFLGSACACAILLTLFVALNKYFKKWKEVQWPWKQLKPDKSESQKDREERCTMPPAVIYSGGFPQIRGSWMVPPVSCETPASISNSDSSLLQRYPGIELGPSQPESPRHNKLRMYNCRADRVLVRKLEETKSSSRNDRIPEENVGADNLSFSN